MQQRFQSIAAQVAASLREEIASGEKLSLPSERGLSEQLQVSRRTVRKALTILRHQGLVETTPRRTRVLASGSHKKKSSRQEQIRLLLPEPLERARPFTALWISHLAGLLRESGCHFEVVHGEKYYGAVSHRLLTRLAKEHQADCWILARSNQSLQQWFHEQKLPAVIAGSTYPGIGIPSVDTDHTALSHHAVGQFLRHGHTRVALFLEKIRHAGDIETETGFNHGMAESGRAEPSLVCRVDRTPEDAIKETKRLLSLRSPPTAFLLCNSFSYLTLVTYFASLGYRIPDDFSMISQDEGPFLTHVYPTPARYVTNPKKFATALNRGIKQVLQDNIPEGLKIRIMPDFVPGGSVAAARRLR